MTDPRRLLDGGGTDIERTLLAADRAELPDPTAKRRAAAALALGAASAWPSTAHATAEAAKTGVPLIVKVLAIAAVGAGAWGAARLVLSRPAPPPAPVHVRPAVPAQLQEPVIEAPAKPAEPVTPLESLEVAPPDGTARRAPAAGSASSSPRAEGASLSDEIRMLDRARRAHASGDDAGAIRTLDEYQRQYPRGAFAEESTLLRIEALAGFNRAAARSLAQRFRAAHPNSPHLRRIESVLSVP